MFTIKFVIDDALNGKVFTKGDTLKVSRSIRDDKINSGKAIDFVKKTIKKIKE